MKQTIKKLFLLSCCLMLITALVGCNTDKYKKETYKKDLDIAISAEPDSLYSLEPEITEIANEYDKGGILTQAIAVFQGEEEIGARKGLIYFTYCRDDEETGRGTIVIITYDMFAKKVTEVSYEQGQGAFTDTNKEPIYEGGKAVYFKDVFEKIIPADKKLNDKLTKGENIKLTIEFTSEGIYPSLL